MESTVNKGTKWWCVWYILL